jgi:predicted DNA-binding transcriptional regulator AlpA
LKHALRATTFALVPEGVLTVRLIAFKELGPVKGINFSDNWIRHLIEIGKFPKPIWTSPRRKAWIDAELDRYIADLAAQRDANVSAASYETPHAAKARRG